MDIRKGYKSIAIFRVLLAPIDKTISLRSLLRYAWRDKEAFFIVIHLPNHPIGYLIA